MTQDKKDADDLNEAQFSQWVSEQYKESQLQKPSKALDQHIIALAKSKIEASKTIPSVKKRVVWMFPSSIVASIMVIAITYWGATHYFGQSLPVGELTVSQTSPSGIETVEQVELSRLNNMDVQRAVNFDTAESSMNQRLRRSESSEVAPLSSSEGLARLQQKSSALNPKMLQLIHSMLDIQDQLNLTHQQLLKFHKQNEHSTEIKEYQTLYQNLVSELKSREKYESDEAIEMQIVAILKEAREVQILPLEPDN